MKSTSGGVGAGDAPTRNAHAESGPTASDHADLSIIVVSYNRREALRCTLARVTPLAREVIVADNASADGTPAMVRAEFPGVTLLETGGNVGVRAFNLGVARASGDYVLVLDDDSWPEPGALGAAIELLRARKDLAAVTLHPVHPRTNASEWPMARALGANADAAAVDDWPFMGCGNLVRRSAWLAVGGYEEAYFLYRNDTDLAMKLLAARETGGGAVGGGVHMNPAWVVWHDSPAAARKSERWHRLATRNWVWLCRRHGRGWRGAASLLLGWAWAHKVAGARARSHWATLRGAWEGLVRAAPALPAGVRPDGGALRRALELQLKARRAGRGAARGTGADSTARAGARGTGASSAEARA